MYKTQCSLALIALFIGLVRSWEIAVAIGDRIEFYLNDTNTYVARLDSQKITALAYDEVHEALLYVDKQNGNDSICGYDISFRKYECYMKNNGRDIHGLAFDPIRQYLFFTDMKEKSINWLSLKPGYKNDAHTNLLIKLDEGIPTDIAVDTCREYIYWINTNITTSTIERAKYDGSQREVVIHTEYKMDLHSLAIDQQSKKIYWIMPKNNTICYFYSADLEGTNKNNPVTFTLYNVPVIHPKALTVLKEQVVVVDWPANYTPRSVWKLPTPSLKPDNFDSYLKINNAKGELAIVGNYKISEQFEGIQECQHLTRYEGPFCVHGVKVKGQSFCNCTTGYTGARCDFSVCDNYCIYGNCSLNGKGLPKCSCNSGYSGDRCEVSACHGYCTNNGTCFLDVGGQPVCQCIDNYTGDRCEVADCHNYCLQGECTLTEEGPTCSCNSGYSGDRCEVSACHGYCTNNGTCSLDVGGQPVCQCIDNYTGDRCEVISACHRYCINNGTCSLDVDGQPVCQCIDNYTGDRCEVADCQNYCLQGECTLTEEGPTCRCNSGYSGDRCEVNVCYEYCLNNGTCDFNEENTPFCQCLENYYGDRCEFSNFSNEDESKCQNSRQNKNNNELSNSGYVYYPALSNMTLADLLASWRKPVAIFPEDKSNF